MRPRDLARAAAALLLAAPPPAGGLTFYPSASIDTASIKVHTPAGCPARADTYYAVVHGHGFPARGQVVTTPTAAGMSRTEGFDVYFAQTMKDFATDNRTTLKGRYDVAVYCMDSFVGTKYAEFTGALTFSTPTKYRASGKGTTTTAPPVPALVESAPSSDLVSAPVTTPGRGLPIGWIAAGAAAVLLAFETGRRLGRRSATTRR
jgi:hypothetical protein